MWSPLPARLQGLSRSVRAYGYRSAAGGPRHGRRGRAPGGRPWHRTWEGRGSLSFPTETVRIIPCTIA